MRSHYVEPDEEELWKNVSIHYMSDEEDGEDVIKKKTLKDRTPTINNLIMDLDKRHDDKMKKEDKRVLKVKRVFSDSPRKEL